MQQHSVFGFPCDLSKSQVYSTWQDHKNRPGYIGEPGLDIASYNQANIPLHTIYPGIVIRTANDGQYHDGFGNYVEVEHGKQPDGRCYKSLYAHMDTVIVQKGQELSASERIGSMGTTGNSEGVHVHLILWVDGKNVDPEPYLSRNIAPVVEPVSPPVKFVRPVIPTVEYPKAKVSNVISEWLNLRSWPAAEGIDIGDLRTGEIVEVLDVIEQPSGDVWFALRCQNEVGNEPLYGYAAALFRGEVWLEPV